MSAPTPEHPPVPTAEEAAEAEGISETQPGLEEEIRESITEQDQPHPDNSEPGPQEEPLLQAGESIVNLVTEVIYAATGLAALISDKAKALYDARNLPSGTAQPSEEPENGQALLGQMSKHLNKLVDDVSRSFKQMSERGHSILRPSETKPSSSSSTNASGSSGSPHSEAE